MRELINKIQSRLGIHSTRTKNISKHVLLSILYRGGSIIATFLLVPLTIRFLDTENYGVWLTISSFIAWFSFFDVGLGNGLRNKFAEAKAKDDMELAKGFVSTAYFSLGLICLGLFCITVFGSFFIDWTTIFNASASLKGQLQILMPIVFGCLSLQLTAKLIATIYTADQKPSIEGKISFITSTSSLILIWILTQTATNSLLIFGSLFSLLPVLILVLFNVYAFSNRYKMYKPNISLWKKKYFNEIFGLGATFFIIQCAVIVLFSTDNFIIAQLFNPEEVVPYNIAQKYFSISLMVFNMLLTPYWSGFTDAYTKRDFVWIRASMKNLGKFSFGSIILTSLMVLLAPIFYKLWIGDLVSIPFNLTLSMAVFFMICIFYSPYNAFINGLGKVRVQMYTLVGAAVLNIPLSIILVKYTPLGVEGVIIATILCVIPHAIICPLQYSKLMGNRALGIWNK
ncbi:oligosaccharide flippase family protein [Aequorivita todarodis]|uniref:lipopolysaccharide biosynthesis protein n=1 Tax=Aequorivita todarodis TaxID=2036821 RepID=UPI00235072B3|nr:oligosaccharide flippase family protein [Aequorivita todarodis]MDC8001194.1 oligosaccharide flippase family protein [Aequorivita todarodis]